MRSMTVRRAADLFLAHLSHAASQKTQDWYQVFLRPFVAFAGEQKLHDLTPSLLHKWIDRKYGHKSSSAQRAAGRVVCRLINWAMDEGFLDHSPIRKFRKAPGTRREAVLSGADYAALVKAAGEPLRSAIKFLWHTGARPIEMRTLEAAWIKDDKATFPQLKSKGKRRSRVIYLNSMAAGVARIAATKHPTGPIFRTPTGRPWTAHDLITALIELRRVAKVPHACAYTFRHTWITRMLERGVGVVTVAALAGNSPTMIMQTYSHVAENEDHLRAALAAQ